MPLARVVEDPIGDLLPLERLLARALPLKAAQTISEVLVFGAKEAAACVFAGSFLFLLAASGHIKLPGLARYDFLFLSAIAIQALLVAVHLENWREVAVLSLFHLVGMGLELFKTSPTVRSWSYPERAFFHLKTVPLYSGFMYASVASYIMQAWRRFNLRLTQFPRFWMAVIICAAIYANFFTDHYIVDVRWFLAGGVILLFWRTRVLFTVVRKERSMPLVLSFLLIGFFIWIAENIATFFGAWVYPHQARQWAIVGPSKISSWMLLVIISFIIVAALKEIFPKREAVLMKAQIAKAKPAEAD